MPSFPDQVYAIVEQIPRGTVLSYGQIAKMIGNPRAARQVGWAMSNCPAHLPWQRVVLADGSITGGDHAVIRRARLEEEGIPFRADGRVDMERCRWF